MEPSAANEPSPVNGLPTSSSTERAMLREEESYERLDGHTGAPPCECCHGTTVAAGLEDDYDAHVSSGGVRYRSAGQESSQRHDTSRRWWRGDEHNGSRDQRDDGRRRNEDHHRESGREADVAQHGRYDTADSYGRHYTQHGTAAREQRVDLVAQYQLFRQYFPELEMLYQQNDKDNGALRTEISKLKTQNSELKDREEYQTRQMKELNEKLRKVVDESLAIVDRFQPEFDEGLVKGFNGVDAEAQKLATLLNKELSSLEPEAWSQEVMHVTWSKYRDMQTRPFTMEKSMRKWLLKGVVWKALHEHVFQYPFQAYRTGEDADFNKAVDALNAAYSHLWPSPRKCGAYQIRTTLTSRQVKMKLPSNGDP